MVQRKRSKRVRKSRKSKPRVRKSPKQRGRGSPTRRKKSRYDQAQPSSVAGIPRFPEEAMARKRGRSRSPSRRSAPARCDPNIPGCLPRFPHEAMERKRERSRSPGRHRGNVKFSTTNEPIPYFYYPGQDDPPPFGSDHVYFG